MSTVDKRDWREGKTPLNVRIKSPEKVKFMEAIMSHFDGNQQKALDHVITLAISKGDATVSDDLMLRVTAERDELKKKVAELQKSDKAESQLKGLRDLQTKFDQLQERHKKELDQAEAKYLRLVEQSKEYQSKQGEEIVKLKGAQHVSVLAEPAIDKALQAIKAKKKFNTDQDVIRYALTYVLKNDWL